MERIKLNLIPSGVAPIVHLSQYDDGRKFGIDLFEGESVYVLDGTETLTVNSRKPDGHVVVLTVTNTGTSSLDVDTVEQLTAVHGVSYAKLQIVKGSVTIATLPFLIDVSRDPLENGDPSESFVQNLQTQIAEGVAEEVATQYDSANVIFDTEPTDNHGVGYTVTSEGIKTAIDNAFDYDNTASGSLVHIEDGADNVPVKSLVSQIVAVESGSGEKSPDNPYTISGFANGIITRCGKNFFKPSNATFSQDVTETHTDNGITYTVSTSKNNPQAIYYLNPNILKGKTIVFSISGHSETTNNKPYICLYQNNMARANLGSAGNGITNNSMTYAVPNDTNLLYILVRLHQGTASANSYLTLDNPMLEISDEQTTYEAYNGNEYTFVFGQTVYGGYFDNKGNLVVTHGYVDLSEISTGGTAGSGYVWYTTLSNPKTVPNTQIAPITSEKYNAIRYNAVASNVNTIAIRDNGVLYVNNGSDTTQPSGIAVYELATPITLAITSQDIPTLLGENNIFSNCGDVEVEYYTNKSNDILEFIDSEIGKKNGTNILIEANSQDSIKTYVDDEISSTKDYVDNSLSGKEDSITYESDDYNVATYGGVIRCKKWGRMVNIQGYGLGTVTNMSTVQAYTMATIASKYCPTVQQHIIGSMNAGSYATSSSQGYRINTDGTVATYVYSGTKIENGYFNVTYMV